MEKYMKIFKLNTKQNCSEIGCYCYSGYFNQEETNAGDNYYIVVRSIENGQKYFYEGNDFVENFCHQIIEIENDLIKSLFGKNGTEEDLFFYPHPIREDDGAFSTHIVLHCFKKPSIDTNEFQKIIATTLAKKYSLVAGATISFQMNKEVLVEFAKSLKISGMNY